MPTVTLPAINYSPPPPFKSYLASPPAATATATSWEVRAEKPQVLLPPDPISDVIRAKILTATGGNHPDRLPRQMS